MTTPTPAQFLVLRRIVRGIVDWRELSVAGGYTINATQCHLRALRRKGYVAWEPGTRHTLHLRVAPIIEERDGVMRIVAFTKPGEV